MFKQRAEFGSKEFWLTEVFPEFYVYTHGISNVWLPYLIGQFFL